MKKRNQEYVSLSLNNFQDFQKSSIDNFFNTLKFKYKYLYLYLLKYKFNSHVVSHYVFLLETHQK